MAPLSKPIDVVLADDHEMVREALARILHEEGRVQVVAQASDAQQTLEAIRTHNPEVLVLDYSLANQDAPQIIEGLLKQNPKLKILILTVHENVHYAVRVLELGAHGYLIKSAAVEELVQAIAGVHEGRIYLSQRISDEVLQHLRRPKRERVGLDALSQREFDFLCLLGSGKSLQQSADQMGIAVSTASTYRSRIMEKLNLSTTAELIRYAIDQKLGE